MREQPITPDLPDDVVLSVRHVSKKFCRNLRRSMFYGMQDLGRNLLGLRPSRDHRLQTTDYRPEGQQLPVSGPRSEVSPPVVRSPLSVVPPPQSNVHGLKSAVSAEADLPPLRRDEFWALQDINFDVKRGEAVGIIGLNGCGKTTLFRVIHGLFPPDQGEVVVRGRIGALIALGAGFHPHMSGRENIFLNGAILGIRQEEIRARLEEIVDFAEIGEFIDAPVSTYSSGMRVRLGFAVAINMSPDILLIDEVLAVGDLEFRNKCMLHMRKVIAFGRTILFVSHNMHQVAFLCQRAVLLDRGGVVMVAPAGEVVDEYYRRLSRKTQLPVFETSLSALIPSMQTDSIRYRGFQFLDGGGKATTEIECGEAVTLRLTLESTEEIDNPWLEFRFFTLEDRQSVAFVLDQVKTILPRGVIDVELHIGCFSLQPGTYLISNRVTKSDILQKIAGCDCLCGFRVLPRPKQVIRTTEAGYLELKGEWHVESIG